MLEKMRYKYKILLACCAPLVLILIMATIVYINMRNAQKSSHEVEKANAAIYIIKDMEDQANRMARSARGYIISRDAGFKVRFEEAVKGYGESMKQVEGLSLTQDQRDRIKEIATQVASFTEKEKALFVLVDKGQQAEAIRSFTVQKPYVQALRIDSLIGDFERVETARMGVLLDEESAAMGSITKSLVAGVLITIVLAAGFSLFVASRLSSALSGSVNVLSSSSAEMAATVTEHEKTASTQAAMVNETSATVSELGASSQKTAEQATSAADTAKKASIITSDGQSAVKEAIDGMAELKGKVSAVAESILKLGDQIAQIGAIAEMVKDLAAQTNMLALNAAVEAVRAGEHGKGFAVLASEVRKLADQSKRSAEDARAIVGEIQKSANSTIMVTEEGSKTADKVTALAGQVNDLFTRLSEAASSVYDNAQQVLLNARQQSSALGQVVEAVNAISAGSKETASGISQTRVGIQNLNRAAEEIKVMV